MVNVDCVGENRGERQGFFASVTTHSGLNGESFATQLKTHVIELETTRFAVRIDDTKSERLWWDYKGNSEWSSSKEPPNWTTGC